VGGGGRSWKYHALVLDSSDCKFLHFLDAIIGLRVEMVEALCDSKVSLPMALSPSGWGNEELQIYASENASVRDGVLILTATKEGACFKSAKLCTKGKIDFCPGAAAPNGLRLEARIKLPKGIYSPEMDLDSLACMEGCLYEVERV
jgi:hypothetical protein